MTCKGYSHRLRHVSAVDGRDGAASRHSQGAEFRIRVNAPANIPRDKTAIYKRLQTKGSSSIIGISSPAMSVSISQRNAGRREILRSTSR